MRKGITSWDPFCGTGTIILTMLIRKFNKSIRRSMFLPLYQIPIFKHTYIENEQNELDINILANDINEQQLRIFYKILDCFNNLKRIIRQQSPKLRSKSFQNLSIAQLDFISMHKEFIKGKLQKDDLIVITNPPWGRTVNLDKFNKMTQFLETNMQLMLFIDQNGNYWQNHQLEDNGLKLLNMIEIERLNLTHQRQQLNRVIKQSHNLQLQKQQQKISHIREILINIRRFRENIISIG
ncbi:unnamed protein product [Paramecium primaurelia]|uniref:Ribosomal RNA large subunit methyltransferase K/L-like methyltransferase domain-containing protein n=1 Tax=Paramecium primaurelia TaxID=5886 RepID=A0A8S1PSX3_PARPR|nr:unnamed protein product [Paramecium primaurelia]